MAVGVWFVGARGSLATTATVGVAALGAGMAGTTGLVTALPDFDTALLPDIDSLVIGGHDVGGIPLRKRAEALAGAGVLPAALVAALADLLDGADGRIRPGIDEHDLAEAPGAAIARIEADLRAFRAEHDLESVVVVNVSSTEAPVRPHPAHRSRRELDRALARGEPVLPVSSCYAHAAFDAGAAFVDFTASTGARLPALEELALARGAVHAGRDGKTGETLVKAALAPLFADRNLRVRSWAGTNLLGGGDGASLTAPGPCASKTRSKSLGLSAILGYEPEAPVHIGYVGDLGEWKTAWDHISFEGFLGTRMRLQFTWEGCDSSLAAPLVIDLVRLVGAAQRRGLAGGLAELAFFFKDPWGGTGHRLAEQFDSLRRWASTSPTPPAGP
jgi:myo-inositol-1-phosphate synthase